MKREKYTLYDPQTGETLTVSNYVACRALIGQGWKLIETR